MRRFIVSLIAIAGLGLLAFAGCTDAGDPVFPVGSTIPVDFVVDDGVGAWDNLQLNGDLTGGSPVPMTQDGMKWTGRVEVPEAGTYGFDLVTDDGVKALVTVRADLEVVVDAEGGVSGDTDLELKGNANEGFRIVVLNENPAYTNIKFKGAPWDEDWSTVERDGMSDDGVTNFRNVPGGLAEGTYEWGAIEDNGEEFGIWLIEGPNPVVTVSAMGAVSGTLVYEIASPEPATTLTFNCDMNTFEGGFTTVHVRGTFNGWAEAPTDLSDPDEDGVWSVTVDAEQSSEVIFKFITDGSNYEDVPPACGADDGFGGYNRSVLVGTESTSYTSAFSSCPPTR